MSLSINETEKNKCVCVWGGMKVLAKWGAVSGGEYEHLLSSRVFIFA